MKPASFPALAAAVLLSLGLTGVCAAQQTGADDLSQFKTADALWQYIQVWAAKDPHIDQNLERGVAMEKVNAFLAEERAHLTPACAEFVKRYPQDARRWNAKLVALSLQQGEEGPANPETERTLQGIAAAPDATAPVRKKARQALLGIHVGRVEEDGPTPGLDAEMASYEKDYPDDPDGAQFVTLRMHFLGPNPPPDEVMPLLTRLAHSPNTATAGTAQAMLDVRTKPSDLKFTAADGREVDLAKLRGKVVLLDFWATWCVPCMQEVPVLVAAYKKYHDRGFEIVGISMDEDKSALEKVTGAKGMTWPQYFDGKGQENAVARRYGIDGIPVMWLLGPDGKVANFSPREDLENSIEKLLDAGAAAPGAAGVASTAAQVPSGASSQP